jgi:hypothetical protein
VQNPILHGRVGIGPFVSLSHGIDDWNEYFSEILYTNTELTCNQLVPLTQVTAVSADTGNH